MRESEATILVNANLISPIEMILSVITHISLIFIDSIFEYVKTSVDGSCLFLQSLLRRIINDRGNHLADLDPAESLMRERLQDLLLAVIVRRRTLSEVLITD